MKKIEAMLEILSVMEASGSHAAIMDNNWTHRELQTLIKVLKTIGKACSVEVKNLEESSNMAKAAFESIISIGDERSRSIARDALSQENLPF